MQVKNNINELFSFFNHTPSRRRKPSITKNPINIEMETTVKMNPSVNKNSLSTELKTVCIQKQPLKLGEIYDFPMTRIFCQQTLHDIFQYFQTLNRSAVRDFNIWLDENFKQEGDGSIHKRIRKQWSEFIINLGIYSRSRQTCHKLEKHCFKIIVLN